MAENNDIVDLLEGRRANLLRQVGKDREQLALAEQHLEKTEGELRTIEAALKAIRDQGVREVKLEPNLNLTIKQGVVKILERTKRGLTAIEILSRLGSELDMHYERTSLSPQLSRLKRAGVIRLDGNTWSLVQRDNGSGA